MYLDMIVTRHGTLLDSNNPDHIARPFSSSTIITCHGQHRQPSIIMDVGADRLMPEMVTRSRHQMRRPIIWVVPRSALNRPSLRPSATLLSPSI